MVYLSIVNGRNQNELVKLYEGEIYEIDRLTINFISSDDIRKRYKAKLAEFKKKYPHAADGAVRIYGDGVYSENGQRVLYKKHKVAFNHIIKDKHFLRWTSERDLSGRYGRVIKDVYILRGITQFHREITRINQYIKELKRKDKEDTGLTGGSTRYYLFMRALLNRYEEYRKIYHKPSIDEIWKEHLRKLDSSKTKLVKKTIKPNSIIKEDVSLEEYDHEEFDIKLEYEEPLYEFFTGDYFEQYYGNIFVDDELVILTDTSKIENNQRVASIINATEICYNGIITIGNMKRINAEINDSFNQAQIIIFYVENDSQHLELLLAIAKVNHAKILLVTNDLELLQKYQKRYKNIIPLFDNGEVKLEKMIADFFAEEYRQARGYHK